MVKNLSASAGDTDSIPGLGRSPGGGHGTSSILAWEILWTEEPGGRQSMGSQRAGRDFVTKRQQQLLYNVVLVSAYRKVNRLDIYIYTPSFWDFLPI